jgi:hypothetical protein
MKFKDWFAKRGFRYVYQRARTLLGRYRISSSQAVQRIDACLEQLVAQDCAPTFPTPGIVVQHNPKYFRHLQAIGAEIAVHSYQHVDLKAYPVDKACQQLVKAATIFKYNGIEVHGFRCPYLGCNDEIVEALPKGLFEYSSNNAIYWNALNEIDTGSSNVIVDTLRNIYGAEPSSNTINVPWSRSNMLEIPVSMPDDMELVDGLNLTPAEVAQTWCQVLKQTHQRGELFNLIFHPELAVLCEQPFVEVLSCAKSLQPFVWVVRLCDISAWWAEKASFRMEVTPSLTGLHLDFVSSPRATILVKGFDLRDSGSAWYGPYQRLHAKTLEMPASPRPLLGLSAKVSRKVLSFLMEQGYILDTTETASGCGIYLDEAILAGLNSETALINYIEACSGPLVRYWRWPNGAKSALSITGDLDALSLLDYLSRLYVT